MNRMNYFEFATDDFKKTADFYRDVFGWEIKKWNGPFEYYFVTTGDGKTPGINGGLVLSGGPFKGTVNTINVDDIDAVIAKVLAHSGEIVEEKEPIQGVGYQAYIKDNAGIMLGLHQADPKAGL